MFVKCLDDKSFGKYKVEHLRYGEIYEVLEETGVYYVLKFKDSKSGIRKFKKTRFAIINKEETNKIMMDEFQKLSEPLSDWLYKNGNSHSLITITQSNADVYGLRIGLPFKIRN
jgi:hypothetical protein